eukprot:gene5709-4087_t
MELDKQETIQAFEAQRFVKYHSQFLRNRSYWRELRKIQQESFADSRFLVEYLRKKVKNVRHLVDAWKSFCTKDEKDLQDLKKQHSSFSYHNMGEMVCQMITDAEQTSQRQLLEALDQVEHQIIPQALEKLTAFERTIATLGEKGKACLFACVMMEHRVQHYYQLLTQSTSSQIREATTSGSTVTSDRFVLIVRYYAAVHRQRQLIEKTNQHFRVFFQTAKELDSNRLSLIARIADSYMGKIAEVMQKLSVGNKTAIDSLKTMPQHLLMTHRNFAEELDRRVRDSHVNEQGNFERLAALQLAQRQLPVVPAEMPIPSPSEPPTSLDLLQHSSSTLHHMFVCHHEEIGYVLSSWNLVLVAITKAGYLHVLKYPGQGEDLQLPVATVFARSVNESKYCFEDDVCSNRLVQQASTSTNEFSVSKPVETGASLSSSGKTVSSVPPVAGGSPLPTPHTMAGDTISWHNERWRHLMQQVHLEDLDAGRDHELWQRLALKTRIQQDAIQMVSLIHASRTSQGIAPSSSSHGTSTPLTSSGKETTAA